jgi:DNA-binding response OmpR family regulator
MKADRVRVLVIDDEANFRESLAELVESEGFAALEARDGRKR